MEYLLVEGSDPVELGSVFGYKLKKTEPNRSVREALIIKVEHTDIPGLPKGTTHVFLKPESDFRNPLTSNPGTEKVTFTMEAWEMKGLEKKILQWTDEKGVSRSQIRTSLFMDKDQPGVIRAGNQFLPPKGEVPPTGKAPSFLEMAEGLGESIYLSFQKWGVPPIPAELAEKDRSEWTMGEMEKVEKLQKSLLEDHHNWWLNFREGRLFEAPPTPKQKEQKVEAQEVAPPSTTGKKKPFAKKAIEEKAEPDPFQDQK